MNDNLNEPGIFTKMTDPAYVAEKNRAYNEHVKAQKNLVDRFQEALALAGSETKGFDALLKECQRLSGEPADDTNPLWVVLTDGLFTAEEVDTLEGIIRETLDKSEREAQEEFMVQVGRQLMSLRAAKEAKRQLNALEFSELPPVLTGDEFLALDFPEEDWLFEGLVERNQRVVLSGGWKSGKTTAFGFALKALCDGGDYMGVFEADDSGSCPILYLNLEVPTKTFYNYLFKTIGLQNRRRLLVHNLLGEQVNVLNDMYFDRLQELINSKNVCALFVDPLMQFYVGDENSNTEAKSVTDRLDQLMTESDTLQNIFIVSHTGHVNGTNQDEQNFARPRGASKWSDWADVLLSLTRSGEDRYFAARGRNGEILPSRLRLLPNGGGLQLDQGVTPRAVAGDRVEADTHAYIVSHPNCGTSEIKAGVRGASDAVLQAINDLVTRGAVVREVDPNDGRRRIHRSTL